MTAIVARTALALVLSLGLLSACTESTPPATPTPLQPTASPTPSPSPQPTPTPLPTATAVPAVSKDGINYVNLGVTDTDSYLPIAVTADPALGHIYVYNSLNGGDGQDTLSVIRSDTREISQTVRLGGGQSIPSVASQLLVDDVTHRVYALNGDSEALLILDGETLSILFIIHGARRVALAPDKGRVYLINEDGQVKALSSTDYRPLASQDWEDGFEPNLMAYNAANDSLYLAQWDFDRQGVVVVLDGTTLTKRAEIPIGSPPYGIQVDPVVNEVYVATDTGLTIIDGANNEIAKALNLGISSYNPSRSMAMDPAGRRLYVSANAGVTLPRGGKLFVFDTASRTVTETIPTKHFWQDITFVPEEETLYAVPAANDAVLVADATGQVTDRVMLGTRLLDMAVEPATGRVWAVDSAGSLHILENPGLRQVQRRAGTINSLDGALEASALAFAPGTLYLADFAHQVTRAIDTRSLEVIQSLKAAGPLAIDVAGQRLFVLDKGIQVYGLGTGKPLAKIALSSADKDMAALDIVFEPTDNRLYVKMRSGVNASAYRTYWRMYDGKTLNPLSTFNPDNRDVVGIALSPEKGRIYLAYAGASDWDRGMAVYDMGGAELDRLKGLTGELVRSPDGKYIYLLRDNGIWAVDREKLDTVALLPLSEIYEQMILDPTGQWLYLRRGASIASVSVADLLAGGIRPFKRVPESMGLPASTYRSPSFEADHSIYAVVPGEGVYRSQDSGQTWQLSSRGLRDLYVTGLTFSETYTKDGTISLNAGRSVYRSQDRGGSWRKISAWAPALAFASARNGRPEIYLANGDGSQVRRLTKGGVVGQHPQWDPEDKWIAFDSDREGKSDIYVIQSDGYGLARLTDDPASAAQPAWSPDGSLIAFVSTRDGNPDIYVMDVDGSNVRPLTTDPAEDRDPTWSPDGRKIAFFSNREGQEKVFVLDLATGEIARLTDSPAQSQDPAWSADGKWIAFASNQTGRFQIFRVHPDGSGAVQITQAKSDQRWPAWMADSQTLAFSSNRTGAFQIYLTDLNGKPWRRLIADDKTATSPAWVHR